MNEIKLIFNVYINLIQTVKSEIKKNLFNNN